MTYKCYKIHKKLNKVPNIVTPNDTMLAPTSCVYEFLLTGSDKEMLENICEDSWPL